MHKAIKRYCRDCVSALLVMLVISCAAICAEATSADDTQPVQTAKQRLQTRITYSCVDLPIDKVLMDLAEQAKIDIVKSPKVSGNVTVKVTDVPLEEALSNILAAHDYTYIATESMVRVVPLSEIAAAREPLVTKIYKITYSDANEAATALQNFVSPQGKIALNRGTCHVIVTDTEGRIKGIDKFIDEIDQPTPQVMVEVRIYDITSQEGFEISPEWRVGRNAPLTGDVFVPPSEVTQTEIGRVDSFQNQTTRTVGIERGDPDDFTETLREHSWTEPTMETESTFTNPPIIFSNLRRKPFVGGTFDRIDGGTLRFSLLDNAVDVDFVLSILHQQLEAKLLANPRVLVLDNETARFEIIREIPYRELRQVAREDPITYTEFKNIGVNLQVTPHIAKNGMIRLHIVPEFGSLVSQDASGTPTVDTRRADTTAMVKDGQTIVMGGLRKREDTKDVTKVPVLGDIPLFGGLFQSETKSKVTRELVVFITPRIVAEPALTETEQKQFEDNEKSEAELTELTELIKELQEKE